MTSRVRTICRDFRASASRADHPTILLSALLILLIVPLAGCASGMKMSSRRVCESAGGTYSSLTCYPNVPKGAEQMCLANGGVYLTSEDYCDIPIR